MGCLYYKVYFKTPREGGYTSSNIGSILYIPTKVELKAP